MKTFLLLFHPPMKQLKLMSGKVKAYGHLARLEYNRAHMRDGQVISDIDAILFCTGYKPDFSFVEADILEGQFKRLSFQFEEYREFTFNVCCENKITRSGLFYSKSVVCG